MVFTTFLIQLSRPTLKVFDLAPNFKRRLANFDLVVYSIRPGGLTFCHFTNSGTTTYKNYLTMKLEMKSEVKMV